MTEIKITLPDPSDVEKLARKIFLALIANPHKRYKYIEQEMRKGDFTLEQATDINIKEAYEMAEQFLLKGLQRVNTETMLIRLHQVLSMLINTIPSGKQRNELTEENIGLMEFMGTLNIDYNG